MSAEGWSAKGLLKPLWGRVGGRDALAAATGIPGNNLSAMNTGNRPMGHDAGERIAAALGVTIYELGAPRHALAGRYASLFDRLEALEGVVETQGRAMTKSLDALAKEVRALDKRRERTSRPAKRTAGQ